MVEVRSCDILDDEVDGLDAIRFYKTYGQIHCADITCIDGLVGRIPLNSRIWAILDRNGEASKRSYDLDSYIDDTANAADSIRTT